MSDTNLKPGDTVKLKSRGPVMTIEHIESEASVMCKWFSGAGSAEELKEAEFGLAMLEKWDS